MTTLRAGGPVAVALALLAALAWGCGGGGSACQPGFTNCLGECVMTGTDARHCGTCGHQCDAPAGAHAVCLQGTCDFACNAGYSDADGDPSNGCELQCFSFGEERCNGRDDDCDGIVDNGETSGVRWNCVKGDYVACATPCDQPGRMTGSGSCPDTCMAEEAKDCVPPGETCDGRDNDCDGTTDEGQTGEEQWDCKYGAEVPCRTSCDAADGKTGTGHCGDTCLSADIVDCTPPPETCDGRDNDCDTVPDNGSPEAGADPWDCVRGGETACRTSCDPEGAATGTGTCPATCYSADVTGCEVPDETCDGRDNDCDDQVDEGLYGRILGDSKISLNDGTRVGRVDLAWTGSHYSAVWDEGSGSDNEIMFNVINDDGVGGTPRALPRAATQPRARTAPSVAWDGTANLGVVWAEDVDASPVLRNKIHFIAASAEGEPALAANVQLDAASAGETEPKIVWASTAFAAAWVSDDAGQTAVSFAKISTGGTVLEGPVEVSALSASGKTLPDLAWSGSGFAVVWTDDRSGSDEVFASILDADGGVVRSNLRVNSFLQAAATHAVAWDGSRWAVLAVGFGTGGGKTLHLLLLGADGGTDGTVRLLDTQVLETTADLAWDGTLFTAAWHETSGDDSDVKTLRVTAGAAAGDYGPLSPIMRVTIGIGAATAPSLAVSPTTTGLEWIEERGVAGPEVYFTALGCLP